MKHVTKYSLAGALLVVGFILGMSCSSSAANGPAQTNAAELGEVVSVNTVAAMKGQDGVVVLDVREPSEYQEEHIPGVVHIPMGEAIQRKSEYIDAKVLFVTCRSGNRSGRIAEELRSQGHSNVHNMAGGIRAWKSAGLAVESGK